MTDTVVVTARELDLFVSQGEVAQAVALLTAARDRLQVYPEFGGLVAGLDILVTGAEVMAGAIDEAN